MSPYTTPSAPSINVPSGPCGAAVDLASAVLAASIICDSDLTLALRLPAQRAQHH